MSAPPQSSAVVEDSTGPRNTNALPKDKRTISPDEDASRAFVFSSEEDDDDFSFEDTPTRCNLLILVSVLALVVFLIGCGTAVVVVLCLANAKKTGRGTHEDEPVESTLAGGRGTNVITSVSSISSQDDTADSETVGFFSKRIFVCIVWYKKIVIIFAKDREEPLQERNFF